MADRHAPLAAYAPRSPAAVAIADLWRTVERRLAKV
jgi:chromosome partitioning protein